MKALRRWGIVFLIITLLSTAVPAAFGGRGGGHHREPGHNQPGDCYLEGDFQHYNHENCNIDTDCPNAEFYPHHDGNTVSADIDGNSSFNGGFCVRADLTQGNETLVIDCQDIIYDKAWLKDTVSGIYYPIDNQANNSIEIADNGWADSNTATGEVEAEALFSTTTTSEDETNTSSGSSGGGCNAAPFDVVGVFAVLGIWGKLVHKDRRRVL